MEKRIKYLESKLPKGYLKSEEEKKDYQNFSKYAQYMGNGVYSWRGIVGTDTNELFLMAVLSRKGIEYKKA